MNTHPYNDYVLSACHEAGWITDEQQQVIRTALEHIPGGAALDLMVEQQILSAEQAQSLLDLIQQAEAQHAAAEQAEAPAVHADTSHLDHVHDFLRYAVELGCSDIHLGPDAPALVREAGRLRPIDPALGLLSKERTEALAREFLNEAQLQMIHAHGSVDFCYDVPGLARFRASVVRQRRGWESVFRVINTRIRTMQELGLPEILYTLTRYHNGLILVTGAVGSGKSTTLASMIQHINEERHDHIITLEDPIEYVFTPAGCQVSQREIHTHTQSFGSALRASLREDPDVIMVGEMRDLETISLAITASETGHLVLGTLHTSTAARTLDRLLDVFPIEQQAQIRTMVSESIRGIICQQLVPRADGKGRALALEVMTNSPAVANLIREAKTFMLPGVMQTGKRLGMRLMDDSLMELLQAGIITGEEAFLRAENKKVFAQSMAGAAS
jgi:twitching motility protein PilT